MTEGTIKWRRCFSSASCYRCVDPTRFALHLTAALAAWYARHHLLLASATRSTAMVPAQQAADGFALRARMMTVAEYHIGDDPDDGPRVAALRGGNGYLDLANDLIGVAEIYVKHEPTLRHDKKRYREEDAEAARRAGNALLTQLSSGETPEEQRWSEMQARAWTLLSRTYDEVRRGGLFLFHADDPTRRFPSLVGAARGKSGGASETPDEEAAGEAEPVAPAAGESAEG